MVAYLDGIQRNHVCIVFGKATECTRCPILDQFNVFPQFQKVGIEWWISQITQPHWGFGHLLLHRYNLAHCHLADWFCFNPVSISWVQCSVSRQCVLFVSRGGRWAEVTSICCKKNKLVLNESITAAGNTSILVPMMIEGGSWMGGCTIKLASNTNRFQMCCAREYAWIWKEYAQHYQLGHQCSGMCEQVASGRLLVGAIGSNARVAFCESPQTRYSDYQLKSLFLVGIRGVWISYQQAGVWVGADCGLPTWLANS